MEAATTTPTTGSTIKQMREEDAGTVRDWIDSMAGEGLVRVSIIRKRPDEFNGKPTGGSLETVEERIDEDYIRDVWGGGTFQLKVMIPKPDGGWQYFRARTIKVAGDPKMHGQEIFPPGFAQQQPAEASSDPLASQAFSAMERNMRLAQERADRVEERSRSNGGFDYEALNALNAPLIAQLESAQSLVRDLQQRVMDQASERTDPFRDRILEKMVDGESARIDALRQQFESEMRQLREHQQAEIKMIREQHRDDMKQQDRRHEREIDMMRNSYEAQVKSNDVAYGTRTDGLKSEVDRLNRELNESRAEAATLRAKKDQTLPEKADELIKVKEALSGLGGDSDDPDKPWYERLISAAGNSQVALDLVNKVTGGGEQAQQQDEQEQLLPPVGMPFQGPDGNVYVRNPDNSVTPVDMAAQQRRARAAQIRAARKQQQAQGQMAQPGPDGQMVPDEAQAEGQEPPPRPPDKDEVAIAINFMEGAIRNNTEPAQFAATARNLIPGDILRFIAKVGVDQFLNTVANLEPGSPLTTQTGRNFARAVGKHLLEGSE
ncbi:MAG: keratin [Deltaproteobacteria bacterium]|nr:keratin [Deltaproteobacteria bacterium]